MKDQIVEVAGETVAEAPVLETAPDTSATPDNAPAITLNPDLPAEAPTNPKTGDFVVHCAHVADRKNSWYWCENTTFKRGDYVGKIDWMLLCMECELVLKSEPSAQVLSNIGIYQSEPNPHLVTPHFPETPEASETPSQDAPVATTSAEEPLPN